MGRFINQFKEPSGSTNPKFIMLGTMAGSNNYSFPYSGRNNQMWQILPSCFGENSLMNATNEEKNEFLVKHQICMWDICKCADREGSSDRNIKNEVTFDIPEFVGKYPAAKIICVGNKAFELFRKHFPKLVAEKVCSSSASYRTITVSQKIEKYKEVFR
ncbi:MAG: hypothetical protein MJ197_04795 [Bacteroidales bacterium]|nr:hypothetical protein [Bacteroidales bacterium]